MKEAGPTRGGSRRVDRIERETSTLPIFGSGIMFVLSWFNSVLPAVIF
jgi:hypothetical protein